MRDPFSLSLMRLNEAGLIDLWVSRNVDRQLRYDGIKSGDTGNVASRKGRTGNRAVSLLQLQAAFFLLAGGILLSIIAFVKEKLF